MLRMRRIMEMINKSMPEINKDKIYFEDIISLKIKSLEIGTVIIKEQTKSKIWLFCFMSLNPSK